MNDGMGFCMGVVVGHVYGLHSHGVLADAVWRSLAVLWPVRLRSS